MAGAADRRKSSGGDGGGEGANWMDTYGDLVTLLLTFFVLLFAFSTIDAAKWNALVGSFTGMSVMSVTPLSPDIAMQRPINEFGPKSAAQAEADLAEEQQGEEADPGEEGDSTADDKMYKLYEFMGTFIAENEINAEVVLIKDEYTVKMVFNDMVFFDTAQARLRPESLPILDKMIQAFHEADDLYELLRVEGHTDKRPINTAQYPSNWELSCDRAVKVISYFRQSGQLDNNKLAAVGYGEERPLVDDDTPEAYAMNRRVEFYAETAPLKPRLAG
jgi:chemotaxis protein MotB